MSASSLAIHCSMVPWQIMHWHRNGRLQEKPPSRFSMTTIGLRSLSSPIMRRSEGGRVRLPPLGRAIVVDIPQRCIAAMCRFKLQLTTQH